MNHIIREKYKETFSFIEKFVLLATEILDVADTSTEYNLYSIPDSLMKKVMANISDATDMIIKTDIFDYELDNETSIILHMDYFVYTFILTGLKVRMEEKRKSSPIVATDTINILTNVANSYINIVRNRDMMLYIMI